MLMNKELQKYGDKRISIPESCLSSKHLKNNFYEPVNMQTIATEIKQ